MKATIYNRHYKLENKKRIPYYFVAIDDIDVRIENSSFFVAKKYSKSVNSFSIIKIGDNLFQPTGRVSFYRNEIAFEIAPVKEEVRFEKC